jgi:predicted ATPase/DNA-binding winged helix-turn-helix (wHTH) protein
LLLSEITVADRGASPSDYSFGEFRLIPSRQLLLESEKPLHLGSRALEILTALVERAGEVVTKEEIIARVWPNTFIEEGNLRVHIAAIRKILGDGRGGNRYLANVPGRGYSFVAPVTPERQPLAPPPPREARPGNYLPTLLTRIVGRDHTVAALAKQLAERRFLTIVGPGGMGKTTVAIAVAETVRVSYPDGVWLVGLSSLSDPDLVPSALLTALGIPLSGGNLVSGLTAWVRDKEALIVLDSCEHVISEAASIAEVVLNAAPQVRILATSREPLRAAGEWLHRLHSLELPPMADLTADEAMQYSAVQLFVERAMASTDGLDITDADVPAVLEICRSLDGMPLALELAAARVDALGLKGLAVRLDDRLRLLKYGRRTAPPRHQTLTAALDWSYDLLPEHEKVLLRRLSIFCGIFTLASVHAVVAAAGFDVVEGLANLVAKSLVSADVTGAVVQYKLLDTTRAYAMHKLNQSGEFKEYARRHAEHYRDLFERTEAEWEARRIAELLEVYGGGIDDVRNALNWAFSPGGDTSIGVGLTAAAVPLLMHLSPLNESRSHIERALAALGPGASEDARLELKLCTALGASLIFTRVGMSYDIGSAWTRTLAIAESLDNIEYQLRALRGLWSTDIATGQLRSSLMLAQRFYSLATRRGHPSDQWIGRRLIGTSQHYLGDQLSARQNIERVLADCVAGDDGSRFFRFQLDLRVTARVSFARILWLQGFPDQAMHTVRSCVEEARELEHPISLCYALVVAACPIACRVGDLSAAEHYVGLLLDYSTRYALEDWHACGRCHQGVLAIKRGDVNIGLPLLRASFGEIAHAMRYNLFMGALGAALGDTGQVSLGLAAIEEAIDHSERTEERWAMAELLRQKGELVLLQGASDAEAAAQDLFRQALDLTRQQGALSWELRASTSLARLLRDQGRFADALASLQPVYDRFTEGFGTADLAAARTLIDALQD